MRYYKLPELDYEIPIYGEKDHWVFKITLPNFNGITWNGKICIRDNVYLNDRIVRHEKLHSIQQKELTYPIFLILYCLSWIWNVFKMIIFPITLILIACKLPINFGHPYRRIPFEREAYLNQNDSNFILNRKKHYYLEYVFKKKEENEL